MIIHHAPPGAAGSRSVGDEDPPPRPAAASPAPASRCGIHRTATNVNDARKALREQACPGIGCL